jgi:hexokinase
MKSDGNALFDFIAHCVQDFIKKHDDEKQITLGFTFSFPVNQTGVASGTLIKVRILQIQWILIYSVDKRFYF